MQTIITAYCRSLWLKKNCDPIKCFYIGFIIEYYSNINLVEDLTFASILESVFILILQLLLYNYFNKLLINFFLNYKIKCKKIFISSIAFKTFKNSNTTYTLAYI